MYQVELPGSKVTELTANVTAELIYALFDADGNDSLLNVLFDNCKGNKAISLAENQNSK